MSRRRETWVYGCLCVVIALGIIFWFVNPIIAILVVIIALLTIGIIFVNRTQNYEASSSPPTRPPSPSEEEDRPSILETFPEPDFEPTTDLYEKSPERKVSPPTPEPLSEPETKDSTEELQQRIAELEKRVQSLNKQLARDPLTNEESSTPSLDETERSEKDGEEELSEKATQHLLERLDEKLAKRAISKQLYNRLRDKYIARMEKAKRRRLKSAKRGTKDSIAGDQ